MPNIVAPKENSLVPENHRQIPDVRDQLFGAQTGPSQYGQAVT